MSKIVAETTAPNTRFRLKAKIIETGHPTFFGFANLIEIHPTYLSRILNGWDWPSPTVQRRMASALGLTLRELRELL